jgi:hypothetical protein
MSFGRRAITPRSVKKVERAVRRPAKTARQVVTPRAAKKAASTAWRAQRPETGLRQEVEGRTVENTKRWLNAQTRSSAKTARAERAYQEKTDAIVAKVEGMVARGVPRSNAIAEMRKHGGRMALEIAERLERAGMFEAAVQERCAEIEAKIRSGVVSRRDMIQSQRGLGVPLGLAIADRLEENAGCSGQRADPAAHARAQKELFDESVAGMTRAGWTPQETQAKIVPVLSEIKPFLVLESARLDALRELQHVTGDEAELEALAIVRALSLAQMKMLAEVCDEVASEPFDEDAARFWSWTNAWREAGEVDVERRGNQQKALFARMSPAATERVSARGQQRLDEIVRRADG